MRITGQNAEGPGTQVAGHGSESTVEQAGVTPLAGPAAHSHDPSTDCKALAQAAAAPVLTAPLYPQLRSRLYRFLAWWIGSLLAALPTRWARAIGRDFAVLAVEDTGEALRVWSLVPGQSHPDLVASVPNSAEPSGAAAAFRALRDRMPQRLRQRPLYRFLSAEHVLERRVVLPSADRSVLAGLIALEWDRFMPLPADGLHRAFQVLGPAPEGEALDVVLAAVQPASLQASGAQTGSGTEFAGLAAWSPQHGRCLTFRTPAQQSVALARGRRQAMTAAGVAVLLVCALAGPWWILSSERQALESDLARMRAKTQAAARQSQTGAAERRVVDRVTGATLDQPSASVVLARLTEALPDGSWAEDVTLEGRVLTVKGQSDDVSGLLDALARAPAFEDVRFAGSPALVKDTGLDRFALDMRLTKTGADNGMARGLAPDPERTEP